MSEESKTPGWNHVGPDHPQTKAALSATTPAELRDFVGVRMPAERPTPEVDKAIKYGVFLPENTHSAIEVAKWLERNLAEARNTIAEMETRHAAVMLHTQSIVDNANEAHQKMASAERPTPITDRIFERFKGICLPRPHHCESTAQVSLRTSIENLELQLAEARRRQGGPDVMNAVTVIDAINDLLARAGIPDGETTQRRVIALIHERDAAIKESEEQSRLLGMSGEREARLASELEEYKRCVDLCHDAIGESQGSDITELHKYFEGHANLITRLNASENQLTEMTRQRNMLANSITNAAGVLSSVVRDSALPSSDQS